ncbi:MAG: hypothetical protein NZ700_08945 [Gemmataceae bacterium]|nr:hypothetical protein [Gemmataceae bacterium]MDW8267394.1 hypothetical protein [Gemmataceae bacterium]
MVVSAVLLAWVFTRVPPQELASALHAVPGPWLLACTAGLVLTLYFWDAVCLRWLFSQPNTLLPLRPVLFARGLSYLAGAINYEIGQGLLAWRLAEVRHIPVLAALGRCFLLGLHDLAVLLAFGLLGALTSKHAQAGSLRWVCGGALGVLIGLGLLARLAPTAWPQHRQPPRWWACLNWWGVGRSLRLCLLRGGYYLIILLYALVSLPLCGVCVDYRVVFSVIPLVMVADGLPISVSGLGTRETALLWLLPDVPANRLVAFSLLWSVGLMVGRATLGLVHLWLGYLLRGRLHANNRTSNGRGGAKHGP